MLIVALIFGLAIILTPTIAFIIFTVTFFNSGERKRLSENRMEQSFSAANVIVYICLAIASILTIFNIIIAFFSDSLPGDAIYIGWDLTIFWTLVAWIPILVSLINLKDKGLKHRKWIILSWVLNFLVFFTGMMNPIPQSV